MKLKRKTRARECINLAGGDPISETFEVSESTHYRRLDKFLRKRLQELRLSSIYRLVRKGFVKVNGKKVRDPATELFIGDAVTVTLEGNMDHLKRLDESRELVPLPIPLSILHEDDHLLVVNKPAGLSMHPGKGIQVVTLIEGLMSYGNDRGFRPLLVHRLDKHTSGVLLVAKTPACARNLAEMFRKRRVTKKYLCLAKGTSIPGKGRISTTTEGLDEEMGFRVIQRYINCALVEVDLMTGRKHQIRRQMASYGFPIVGDDVYGDREYNREIRKSLGLRRYFLHCAEIFLRHPTHGKDVRFSAPLPEDLQSVLRHLE